MKFQKPYLYIASAAGILFLIWLLSGSGIKETDEITVPVSYGKFEVKLYTTGELEAKKSIDVKGPAGLRSIGIWRIQIADLVAEGTRVKKGDYIALLDKSEISGKISSEKSNVDKAQSKYTQTRLDTSISLREARQKIIDIEFNLREKKITLEQSKFEPPATVRQAELDLEKTTRALKEANENYQIKLEQSVAKMDEATAELSLSQSKLKILLDVDEQLTIIAPEDGMVIYERDWDGKKKKVGSEVGGWDPTVATLPDLSVMISKTYVNEVDIRKVEKGMDAEITFDAFPDKTCSGKVFSVANVGEQLPNSDAKVFEVKIEIIGADSTLRPGMTTGNNIMVSHIPQALYIPLDAIHTQGDTLTFVYKKQGWKTVKQQVALGATNENHGVILKGLEKDDNILLSIPPDPENIKLTLPGSMP